MAAFGVDADDADLDFVVELEDVFDALDALARLELGDVDHAAEAEEVDEGAIGNDPGDLAEGDGADTGERTRGGGSSDAGWGEAVGAASAELEAGAAQRLGVG